MKKLISLTVLISILWVGLLVGNVNEEPQKFEVTFKVTYNAISLQEAADKEGDFRKRYDDACKVDIAIKKVAMLTLSNSSIRFFTAQGDTIN